MNIRRLSILFYGILVFLWLTPDEPGWLVIPLGITGAALLISQIAARLNMHAASLRAWWKLPLFGALTGAGSAVLTAGLMLFKTGLHNHVYPDYPLTVILGILERLPQWTLAGALIGLATSLVMPLRPFLSARQQHEDEKQPHRSE